jgi:hypothetical protein
LKFKLFVVLAIVVITGYVLDLCFMGMNQPSDLSYVAGIFGLLGWTVISVGLLQLTFKRRKVKNDEKAS